MTQNDRPLADDPSDTRGDTAAPQEAAGHVAFIAKARDDGLDVDALRRLLWLINGHPQLLGHRQCMQNLQGLLQHPELVEALEDWAGAWHADVRRWLAITQWAATLKATTDGELAPFFREPTHERHHVLMHHGLGRHPVAGVLWVRHHSDPNSVLARPAHQPASSAYGLLQWHLTCAHGEARARSSTVEQYEHYSGPDEWPAAPIRTDDAARAVRELSHARFEPLLLSLPEEASTPGYALELIDREAELLESADSCQAVTRMVALLRYFKAFTNMMGGKEAIGRLHGEGAGRRSGSRQTIPGFVHFNATPSVFFEPAEAAIDDEDVPRRDFVRVYVSTQPLTPQAVAEVESEGLAPQEELRPIVDLFPADTRAGGMSSVWLQRLALEAAAQRHPYDRRNLTRKELKVLLAALDESPLPTITEPASKAASAEAKLAVRGMLLLGCSLEEARGTRLVHQERIREMACAGVTEASTRWVVHDGNGTCVGLAVKTVQPRYKSEVTPGFHDSGNLSEQIILLPDATALGAQLLAHCWAHGPQPGRAVFAAEPSALKSEVAGLLARVNKQLDAHSRPRVTLAKIQDALSAQLFRTGLDETAVALIVADPAYAREARLHYTQHCVADLRRAYERAATRLLRDAGAPRIRSGNFGCHAETNRTAVAGARWVVSDSALRGLVSRLHQELGCWPDHSRSAWFAYHDAFLLYCIVLQGMTTGARANANPARFHAAVHVADRAYRSGLRPREVHLAEALADKDDQYQAKARATPIPERLAVQMRHLEAHARGLWRWTPADDDAPSPGSASSPFVYLAAAAARQQPGPVRPAWIAEQLARHGLQAPATFHRAFLRTRLLQRNCPPQVVDCFLGHANLGELPHGRHSTFDYAAYTEVIGLHLNEICDELNLTPMRSFLAEPGR